jgi:hypothetical protein
MVKGMKIGMDEKEWKCGIKWKVEWIKNEEFVQRDEIGAYEKEENV